MVPFPRSGERLDVPDLHGVYVIYNPKGRVSHVGRTVRGKRGLRQRLNNHLHGASSFVIKALRGKGVKLRKGYKFRYIAIDDSRLRALLESYVIGQLCPDHLGDGQLTS
ncbi:excinuclease UvrABC nuclease subunit [Nitrobacteraceae bacterium AZCC 1564]